jgi:predicted secreted acid phosphatase
MLKIRKLKNQNKFSLKWHDRKNNIVLLSIHDTKDDAYNKSLEFMEQMKKIKDERDIVFMDIKEQELD